jgi:cyanate permease
LVDLLDRILDKGLVLSADVIITLAGVPLVAVNLRAAIASVETMLDYGVMKDFILEQDRSLLHTP